MARIGDHARANRNNPTEPELRLWNRLRAGQLGGLKFRRQHVIGGRIVDLFCPSLALIIEIDGHTHDPGADRRRDEVAEQQGYTTLRFTNTDLMTNLDGVCELILASANSLPPRWPGQDPSPPQPLP